MKTAKTLMVCSALAASALATTAVKAETSVSANVGYVSDYYFRGIFQAPSSASAGLDVSFGPGFYVGTWLADVDNGIEYDLYAGYAGEYKGFSYDIGYVTYNYTNDDEATGFDDTYSEVALGLGYGPISLGYAVGEYDNFSGPTQDYTFLSVTAEYKGAYATYGTFGKDADGDYVELGYGMTISDIDYSVALIDNSEELDIKSPTGEGETQLVFSIGYSWDI